tara:strand:+ start:537 stop:662 length:126 start_codon:yes stop_codon:yes gene_type:complete
MLEGILSIVGLLFFMACLQGAWLIVQDKEEAWKARNTKNGE